MSSLLQIANSYAATKTKTICCIVNGALKEYYR